jgi:type I restriction enzyme S subunit
MQAEISGSEGAVFASINKAQIEALPIVLPPLPEQRRIVAILDEAFEGIATAKAHAERNLRNAREAFNSSLDRVLSLQGPGYVETTLGDEAEVLAGYAFPSKGYVAATKGVRLLRGDNIMQGYLRWEDAKAWPATDCAPYERFALRAGDVVLAMDRPWVKAGLKRAQLGDEDLPSLLLQRTARLRPRGRMTQDFLFRLTGSDSFSRHLLSLQTGIGVPHISGKQIESFRFARPPMDAQRNIAVALDEMDRESQRLVNNYQRKLAALDELKQSLLHQAFSGAL